MKTTSFMKLTVVTVKKFTSVNITDQMNTKDRRSHWSCFIRKDVHEIRMKTPVPESLFK